MKLRIPEYCHSFHCIADKCRDSCCIGWEIDIDNKTAAYYESVGGQFGRRLKENIVAGTTPCFRLDEKERCPFLNESNLCDIFINLGEDMLCDICTEHPRYYEWFDGVKEGGIGLCCEEAARVILANDFSVSEEETAYESADEYDPELYEYLYNERKKIISHLSDRAIPLKSRIADVLLYAEPLQERLDNYDFSDCGIVSKGKMIEYDIEAVLRFMLTLEVIDKSWVPYIESCIERRTDAQGLFASAPETELYLERIAVYFIWRYFMKGVFDGEILSRVKLMAVSCAVLEYLYSCETAAGEKPCFEAYADIAKRYSKEIEYCEENLITLSDAFYELDIFTAPQAAV